MSILQIGAGGVGWVVAHKAAQNNDVLGDITLASRTIGKCEKIIESIKGKNNLKDSSKKLEARFVDADDVASLVALINEVKPDLVINAGPPWVNVTIMEACYQTKVSYLDTSVAVDFHAVKANKCQKHTIHNGHFVKNLHKRVLPAF